MTRFDLRITNGSVLQDGVLTPVDVLVANERVAAIVPHGTEVEAASTIDATGKWVLPGAIDTHTHTRTPGYEYKEDFVTASSAAAIGGVTTMFDMPNVDPPTDTVETFLAKREMADAGSIVDWGHWVAGTKAENIVPLAEAGATGYKIFQVSGAYPHDPRLALTEIAPLHDSFTEIAKTGLPLLVHPFNQELFEKLSNDRFARGEPPTGDLFSQIYVTEEIWSTAVNVLLALQRLTGVRLQLLHTHSAQSLRQIRAAKAAGQRVTAEVDPKYFHLSVADLKRIGGGIVPAGYVLEDAERVEEIWRSLNDGTIDNIATDHAPHTKDEVKAAETDAWTAHLGSPQIEWVYPLTLTDAAEGRLSLSRVVELLCEAPAKLTGVWPRKGRIAVGADADIAVIDPNVSVVIRDEDAVTKVGWGPYVGRTLTARVDATILRGTPIALDGKVVGQPGFGHYIPGTPQF